MRSLLAIALFAYAVPGLAQAPMMRREGGSGGRPPAQIAPDRTLDPRVMNAPGRTAVPDGGTSVPITTNGPFATITAFVNGKGPFRFAVQLSSGPSEITADVARQLGVTSTQSGTNLPMSTVDSLRIGAAIFSTVPVVIPEDLGPGIDGVLGVATTVDLLVTYDAAGATLTLAKGDLPMPNGRDILPLRPVGSFWGIADVLGVDVSIGAERVGALFNAQSPAAITLTTADAERMEKAGAFSESPRVIGRVRGSVLGDVELKSASLSAPLVVGPLALNGQQAGIIPVDVRLPQAAVLGGAILRGSVITIDQRNRRVRISPR